MAGSLATGPGFLILVSFGAAQTMRLRVAPGLAVVVPFRFQRRPTEDTAG